MNRIYSSIFNAALGAWVAVPETAKARGKRNGRVCATQGTKRAPWFAVTVLVAGMTMAGMANANTWTGTTSTDWAIGSNWSDGTSPGAGDDAIINTGTYQPTLSADTTVGLTGGNGALQLDNYTLTVDIPSSDNGYLGGVISGTGALTKTGTGNLTLSGANSYTGTTTLEAGGLTLAGGNAIHNDGAVVVNGGTLTLADSETIGTLSGTGGTIKLGVNTLTVNPSSGSSAYAGTISGTGGLTKTGMGNLTLSGANNYTGGTNLNAGTLTLGNAAAIGTGVLTVLGSAMLDNSTAVTLANAIGLGSNLSIGGTADLTMNGSVNGAGSLTKNGAASLTLNAINGFLGGTNLNAGTLTLGNAAALGLGTLTVGGASNLDNNTALTLGNNVLLNANLAVAGSNDLSLSGAISGSGGLIKNGLADLTLSGSNTYTGTTTLEAGGLTLAGGNAIDNAGAVVVNDGTLTLMAPESIGSLSGTGGTIELGSYTLTVSPSSGSSAYAGTINGTGGLTKTGMGNLTLSGINTYSGTTTVENGLLTVNGSFANSAITVNSGGRLGGSGTVGSLLVNGGIIAPGNSIGTMTVNGNLTLTGSSIYAVEVDPAGSSSDLIQVNGVANLAGQVQHVGYSGTYQPLSTYTILSATTGIVGTFDGVTSDYAFLTPTLSYDSNNVYLGLLRNDTAVADLGRTRNQVATASALDSLAAGSALGAAILGLKTSEVPAALNSLSGELYASTAGAVLQNSQAFSHSLLQRSGNQLDESKRTALPLWIETEGTTRRNDGDSNTGEAIQHGGSVAIGGELAMPNDWILGSAFRYGDHRLSVDDRNSHADIDSYSVGLYGRWAEPLTGGSLRMTLGGIYGWHSIDAERDIYATGLQQSLNSDYNATSRQLFAELGYAMDMGAGIQLEPYAALSWTQVASDSFTEKGGNAALHGDSQNNDMTTSTLGLRSQVPLNNGQFQLDAGLGWQHNYSDVNPDAELNFVGSSNFTVEGASMGCDTALLDLGASYRIAPAVTVRAGYSGQFGDKLSSNSGNLTLIWEL